MMKKQTTVDPVCGMQVDPATAAFALEYEGRRYAFCCGCCMKAFKADATRIVANTAQKPQGKGGCCA